MKHLDWYVDSTATAMSSMCADVLANDESAQFFRSEYGSAFIDYLITGDLLAKAQTVNIKTRETLDALIDAGRIVSYELSPPCQRWAYRLTKRGFVVFKYRALVRGLDGVTFESFHEETAIPTKHEGPHRPLRSVRKWARSKLGEVIHEAVITPVSPVSYVNISIELKPDDDRAKEVTEEVEPS